MSIKLLAMYKTPPDVDAFMKYYLGTHIPLAAKIPGLSRTVINRLDHVGPMNAPSPYFLIAELHFADRAAFERAMASPENRVVGKDLRTFAAGLVTVAVAEEIAT